MKTTGKVRYAVTLMLMLGTVSLVVPAQMAYADNRVPADDSGGGGGGGGGTTSAELSFDDGHDVLGAPAMSRWEPGPIKIPWEDGSVTSSLDSVESTLQAMQMLALWFRMTAF